MHRTFLCCFPVLLLLGGCAPVLVRAPQMLQVRFQLSPSELRPGHTLRITARSVPSGLALRVSGWDQAIVLVPVPGAPDEQEGFLAIPFEAEPGPAALLVNATGSESPISWTLPAEVLPRPPDRTVRLSIRNFERLPYTSESRGMAEVRAQAAGYPGPRLGAWLWPVRGRLSEHFGVWRIYNDGLGAWRHGGYDIAAPGGTPVLAPAAGRVLFTAPFEAHGNTILLDHGYGVITTYLHLRAILVRAGDEVRTGQTIGEVGSTGGSTADHLHFQVNVNGRTVEPGDLLSK